MTTRTWIQCRDLYEQRETTWRLTPEQRAADWADGRCGWCGGRHEDHAALVPVSTADMARTLGNLPTLSPLTLDAIARAAHAVLAPDSELLP